MTFIERNPRLRVLIAEHPVDLAPARVCVEGLYGFLAGHLPDGHVWREGKLAHAKELEAELRAHAAMLGLNEREADVLGFLMLAHDVGRMVEGVRAVRGDPKVPHGLDSVDAIKDAMPATGIVPAGPLWDAIFLAIEHHSDPTTFMELKDRNPAAFGMLTLLRDFDKRGGFAEAARYTSDGDFKARQAAANWPKQRETDPLWGTERGAILPASMIDVFAARQLLIRKDCQSYEAYMLQLLAWVFDIYNWEILVLTLHGDGPNVVLRYLEEQLPREEYERIAEVYATFLKGKAPRL